MEKLQSPGPDGWGSRYCKVKFRAGSAAAETTPKQPNHDGSIEWTEPLTITVCDTEQSLVASVVTRRGRSGTWSVVPDGRFEGFPVKDLPSVLSLESSTGTKFRAELDTFIDEGEPPQPSMDSVEEHEGRIFFPAFAAGDAHAGHPQQVPIRRPTAEDSTYLGSADGPPGWAPAAAARPFTRTHTRELPVSTAVAVAAELVHDEAAGAAAAAAHGSAAPRGGSMYTTPSARRHSSLIARSSSAGFLTRDGSIPGRSREGSFSSFHLARGSSRSLGESLAWSSSQDDAAPPALPSPVGTPSVSRLMDDRFPLEENKDEDSQAISAATDPSVLAWGELALRQASAPATLTTLGDGGAASGAVRLGLIDGATTVTVTTTTGAAPSARSGWMYDTEVVRPSRIETMESAEAGGHVRLDVIDGTRSAQPEEREEPSISFSPAYGAGDSPALFAPQSESRKKKGFGPFSVFKRSKKKLPPDSPMGRTASPRTHSEPDADDGVTGKPLRLGSGVEAGGRAGSRAGDERGRRGPEDTRDERRFPFLRTSAAGRWTSTLRHVRHDSGIEHVSRQSHLSDRPSVMSRPRRGVIHSARQEAAAPASQEPNIASPRSPREIMAQPTAPTAPPPTPPYEEVMHGYDPSQSVIGSASPSLSAARPLPLRPLDAARQDMGPRPGTAGAESPRPPSYLDAVSRSAGSSPRLPPYYVHGTSSLERTLREEEKAEPAEAMGEYPSHDHPAHLRSGAGAGHRGSTVYQQLMMTGRTADRALPPRRSRTEGETSQDEGLPRRPRPEAPRRQRVALGSSHLVQEQRWPEARAQPGASVSQPLSARRAESAPDAMPPFRRHEEWRPAQPEQDGFAETEMETPSYDDPDALGSRYDYRDGKEAESGYSPMTANSTPHASNGPHGRTLYPNERMAGEEETRPEVGPLEARQPRVASVPRSVSVQEVPSAMRTIPPLGRGGGVRSWRRGESRETTDPVCFSCLSPPSVCGGRKFVLKVMAYPPHSREDVLEDARQNEEVEAGLPGGMSIQRGRRVTVKLVRRQGRGCGGSVF